MSLAQFGFRMVTPAEEAARRRRIEACNHLAHADHTTIVYSSGYANILNAFEDWRNGNVIVRCRKCGGEWAAASVTQLGAQRIATNLRAKCRGRFLDAETKAQFREWATAWDAVARSRT